MSPCHPSMHTDAQKTREILVRQKQTYTASFRGDSNPTSTVLSVFPFTRESRGRITLQDRSERSNIHVYPWSLAQGLAAYGHLVNISPQSTVSSSKIINPQMSGNKKIFNNFFGSKIYNPFTVLPNISMCTTLPFKNSKPFYISKQIWPSGFG